MKPQKTLSCQTILRKKNKSENIILSDFGLYHKAIVMEQHGTGTKTDTQLKQTEYRTQEKTYAPMVN